MSKKDTLEAKLGGCINFGSGVRTLFVQLPGVGKGANAICTMLVAEVIAMKTSGTESALARFLHLQIDGGTENVNL
jgi:hypothetical protein